MTTNKKSIVKSLQLLLPDEMGNDKQGLLSNWIEIARNKKLWDYKIEKLKRPGVEIPQPECTQGTRNNDDNSSPPQSPPRRQRRQRNDSTNPFIDAFEILGLQPNTTERERSESDSDNCPVSTTLINTNKAKQECQMQKQQNISKKQTMPKRPSSITCVATRQHNKCFHRKLPKGAEARSAVPMILHQQN